MSPRAQSGIVLHCHQDTPCPAVAGIRVKIGWRRGRTLKVVYKLEGVVDSLRIPPRRSGRTDGLWQHTCFEAFVGAQNDLQYAVFPGTRRLAIRDGEHIEIYDTGNHRIFGVAQAQSVDQTLTFTSQDGLVRVKDLLKVRNEA